MKRSPPADACVGFRGRLGNLMFQYAIGLYLFILVKFQPNEAFRINKKTWHLLGVDKSQCDNITPYTEHWTCFNDDVGNTWATT